MFLSSSSMDRGQALLAAHHSAPSIKVSFAVLLLPVKLQCSRLDSRHCRSCSLPLDEMVHVLEMSHVRDVCSLSSSDEISTLLSCIQVALIATRDAEFIHVKNNCSGPGTAGTHIRESHDYLFQDRTIMTRMHDIALADDHTIAENSHECDDSRA
jgi:hypothetical protein